MIARFRFTRYLLPLLCLVLFVGIPTAPAAADQVKADDELAIAKQAYDDLQKYLYKEPDNTAMLSAAYDEVQKVLGTDGPSLTFTGNANAQWATFAGGVRTLVNQSNADLPANTLRSHIINTMTDVVNDEHTTYLTKAEYDRERAQTRGDTSIVNYGFTRVTVDNKVYIRTVVQGSNIERAGGRAGDQLLAIDGTQITSSNASTVFTGPKEGDTHTITVLHVGDTMPTDLTVTLRKYNVPSVTYRVIDGHIGYIAISIFLSETPGKLDSALADLHRQNVDSLIVDVRDDPGGIATVLESVVGRFVPDRTVIGTNKGRELGSENTVAHSDRHTPDKLPLVVLANDFSGSASEYFTLAMQEFRNAPFVGVKTAGALGSAVFFPLRDGSGLEITISEYTSAKGATLNSIGITPDIPVDNSTTTDVINGRDPQLDAAIMQANMQVMRPAASLPIAA